MGGPFVVLGISSWGQKHARQAYPLLCSVFSPGLHLLSATVTSVATCVENTLSRLGFFAEQLEMDTPIESSLYLG